jgi:putative glutamine amidotransferase
VRGFDVIAHSDDGVVEGILDPQRRFYLGVQWHPERTESEATGLAVVRSLVDASR